MSKTKAIISSLQLLLSGVAAICAYQTLTPLISIAQIDLQRPLFFLDDWDILRSLESQSLISWIFEPQNEHIIVPAKLFWLANNLLGQHPNHGSIWMIIICMGIQLLSVIFIVNIVRKPISLSQKLLIASTAVLLIANPYQQEITIDSRGLPWHQANMLIWVSAALMVYAIARERSDGFRSPKGKISKTIISTLAIIAPWSIGLTYGAGILMGFWIGGITILCKSYRLASLIIASQIGFIAFYQSQVAIGLGESHQFNLRYFIQLINGGTWPIVVSSCLILISLIFSGLTSRMKTESPKHKHNPINPFALTAAILTPAAYSCIFSILTTLARSSLGIEQVNASRYNSITYIPIICLLLLVLLVYRNHFSRSIAISLGCVAILIFGPGSIPAINLPPAFPTWEASKKLMVPNRELLWQYYMCATDQRNIKNYPGGSWCNINYLNSRLNISPGTAKLFIANKLKLTPGN